MEITFYKQENNILIQINQGIESDDWNKQIDWVDCRTADRSKLPNYFQKKNFHEELLSCIEHPEAHPFSNTFGSTIVLNLPISKTHDIYKTDYISVILESDLVITIIPIKTDLFNARNLSIFSEEKHHSISNFIFYILTVKLLARNNVNMTTARNRLQGLEKVLINDPEEISSNELMSCERDISQLSDIIEDQYVGFEILASLSSTSLSRLAIQQTRDTIKGFQPLDKAMQRLEKKAESLRVQYMLIQQEKSTRKINVLTIIQAIFVPLTFIAGVYGMNFIHMPELEWKYAYLMIWLIFVGLASGLLVYFYKKGWFD